MRKIAFTLMAILAMTSVTYAVTFDVLQNPDPAAGLYSYTVRAKGAGINTLGTFNVTGTVNQNGDEWTGAGSANPATDSCVVFGDLRLPDVAGGTWDPAQGTRPTAVTSEAGGTLTNYSATGPTWDDYLHTSTSLPDGSTPIDMLRIVLPRNASVDVILTVWAVEGSNVVAYPSGTLTVASPSLENGDTNGDGHINADDLSNFAKGWYGTVPLPITWLNGDFNGTGTCTADDLSLFGQGWYGPHGTGGGGGEAATAVPEPSTIAMLILGALCLAGYRLRK
ncbi:MAG: PEP-CTERM sorting domain-containing protein [Planctomycetia bacterium]|nr:PEP-CTERM sorting domain-containing protein [Planctomycetia bacterium]